MVRAKGCSHSDIQSGHTPVAGSRHAASVVSSTLERVDWNAELVRGDLGEAVRKLKEEPGEGLYVAGVKLALGLSDLRLLDEYDLVVHPVLTGHGPTLFAGLKERLDLKLVGRQEFRSGVVALRYQPARVTA